MKSLVASVSRCSMALTALFWGAWAGAAVLAVQRGFQSQFRYLGLGKRE